MSTYNGKPRYRGDFRAAPASEPVPEPKKQEEHGKRCPRCGTTYEYGSSWQVDDVLHETEGQCIESLRDRLEEVERKLERHNF